MLQKRWFRVLFRYRVFVALLLIVQVVVMLQLILNSSQAAEWINYALHLISLLVALHIVIRKNKGAYKLTWVFLILMFPIFGGFLYLMFTY
ncbi:MAG: PLDc N-terminal domain-containing protein, partial [Clostridia bacterium]|nr:PLDc N-terminal domain-containing protein [Clostridia bacterium]